MKTRMKTQSFTLMVHKENYIATIKLKIMHVWIYVLLKRRRRRNMEVTHSSGSWTSIL